MKPNRRIITRWVLGILYLLIGITLMICHQLAMVDDYWSGMGVALIVVGALQIIRLIRYRTDIAYKEQTDTVVSDERNRFLGMKAWSWAGYLYVLLAAVATIVFKVMGEETLLFAASGSMCIILVLYWVSYLILRKKY